MQEIPHTKHMLLNSHKSYLDTSLMWLVHWRGSLTVRYVALSHVSLTV